MTGLEGRSALVTGAARGIGFATARLLCEKGMRVAVNDVDRDTAETAAETLRNLGHVAIAVAGDVSNSATVSGIFATVDSKLDAIWLLVNNAGTFHSGPTAEISEQAWDQAFAVDAKAAFLCSQQAIRRMVPLRRGRIVVVASIAGSIVRTEQIAYCSAKAAAIHFSRCLAVEMAPHGITVNCVCPGMTDSGMMRQTATERGLHVAEYLKMIPSGKFATPEDHAGLIAWLASPEAAHVTGQTIHVDGAQSQYHPLTLRG